MHCGSSVLASTLMVLATCTCGEQETEFALHLHRSPVVDVAVEGWHARPVPSPCGLASDKTKATPVAAQCRTAAAPAPATGTVPPTLAGAAPSLPSCAATCCDVYMARPHRVRVKSSQTVWAKFVFQNLLFANLFQDYMKKKFHL